MNSINLFPTEDKQTLKADKLNISFNFASYSSTLTIRDNNKELTIYLNEKVVIDHVLYSVTNLNVSYASCKFLFVVIPETKKELEEVNI